jgi:hypothetical protein
MPETFPTLSQDAPRPSSFTEMKAYDPSIRSQTEDGTVLSRARFTANKMRFDFVYDNLTEADKVLLETMEENVMVGGGTITWIHPRTDVSYTVRLAEPIRFNAKEKLWEAFLIFIEA